MGNLVENLRIAAEFSAVASPFVALLIVWLGFRAQRWITDRERKRQAFLNVLTGFNEFARQTWAMSGLDPLYQQLMTEVGSKTPPSEDLVHRANAEAVGAMMNAGLPMGRVEREPKKASDPGEALARLLEASLACEQRRTQVRWELDRAVFDLGLSGATSDIQQKVMRFEMELMTRVIRRDFPEREEFGLMISNLNAELRGEIRK